MIYTVTFNPALDYVMNLKQLQYKDINRTESEQLYYGGKGINVSVILSRLKVDNIALGFLAGFSGKKIEEMLNAENIKNDFVYLKKGYTRINVKIKADEDYDINAQGPDIESDELNALFDKFENLNQVISSFWQVQFQILFPMIFMRKYSQNSKIKALTLQLMQRAICF